MRLSVVVPVYKNEGSIPDLVERLELLNRETKGELEAVVVVDGSPDRSLERLETLLASARFRSRLLVLSRNFGSFAAIRAGLTHAEGPLFAVMAADLQEPAELILSFRDRLQAGGCDVVVGVREGREDGVVSRVLSSLFWRVYRSAIQRDVPPGGVDVFGCNATFRDHLLSLEERNTTLVGLVFWLGFARVEVPYTRLRRRHGRSAWTLRRRMRYLLDSAFAFSHLPIRLLEAVGLLGLALAFVLGGIVLYAKFEGQIPVPGYAATVIVVIFFGGLNSLGLGLLGEYIWRTFENGKRRPSFVVARRRSFEGREA